MSGTKEDMSNKLAGLKTDITKEFKKDKADNMSKLEAQLGTFQDNINKGINGIKQSMNDFSARQDRLDNKIDNKIDQLIQDLLVQ